MSITVNLRYKGTDGAAKRFAEEQMTGDEYEKFFGEVEEQKKGCTQHP